ncbi:MAG: serine/threonine-protein kinase [Pseudonocardiales bacterium]|nr:serine/threonine-protein kinase [Pseudonocardiales bacterium]
MLGTTFGPYRIEELLGRGGMGEVYRAHDTERDRQVALKVLPPHLAEDAEYQERFRRECRAAARLNEPHIVPIHTFGEIDGRLFLDMRLVEGTDLASWLKANGAMAPEAAVSVVSQIAAALDAAHAAGLVHRDVKPSNVLLAGVRDGGVDRDVFAYLFDFGIARAQEGTGDDPVLTRAGTMPGSLAYIAPERFSGVEGDPRADIYALACVLHQSLTGRPPFEGDLATLMRAHLNAPPPRPSTTQPDLPSGLDQVVAQGMAKDPAQRPASAGALAALARREIGASSQPSNPRPTPQAVIGGTAVIPPGWNSAPRQTAPAWGTTPQGAYGTAAQGYGGGSQGAYGAPPQGAYGAGGGGWGGPPGQGPGGQHPGWTSHPSHPSHPAQPGYPPQPPPSSGNRTTIIIVAVLIVVALVAGGVVWATLAGGSGGGTGPATTVAQPTTTPAAPPSTTPPTSAPSSPDTDRLLGELPAGYGADNCTPEPLQGAVASVVCAGPPTTGTGPTSGTFTRYASVADMDAAFDALADAQSIPEEAGRIEDCDTNGISRARYSRQSGALGGQVGCFTDTTGTAYLFWTDEAAVAIGYVGQSGGAGSALFQWWNTVDFDVER